MTHFIGSIILGGHVTSGCGHVTSECSMIVELTQMLAERDPATHEQLWTLQTLSIFS